MSTPNFDKLSKLVDHELLKKFLDSVVIAQGSDVFITTAKLYIKIIILN